MPIDVKENLKKLEISRCISSRNDKQSCKNFFKNDQPILSLYTKNIREYQIAISEKGHRWKTNFRLMCYLGGSKLSKKSTFKSVPIRNGIEGLAATCAHGHTVIWTHVWARYIGNQKNRGWRRQKVFVKWSNSPSETDVKEIKKKS